MKAPLMHDQTAWQIERYIAAPSSTVAVVGEANSGKYYLAQWIASRLLDQDIEQHPHFYMIDGLKSGIDEVRELQKKLTLHVPGKRAVRRVVLMAHFDSFGHEAQNALLKTLEEPPLDTVVIITVTHKRKVLDTIFSRVPQIVVRMVTLESAQDYIADDTSVWAYHLSGGNPALYCNLLANTDHELVSALEVAKSIMQANRMERLTMVDQLIKDKQRLQTTLDALVRLATATYRSARTKSTKESNILPHHKRLQYILDAVTDYEAGVHQKLVLTRLFSQM